VLGPLSIWILMRFLNKPGAEEKPTPPKA
jgi:hypothetical protein